MGRRLRGMARFMGNVMAASQPGFYPETVRGVAVPEPEDPPAWTADRPASSGGEELVIGEPLSTGPSGTRQPQSKARRKKG